jgi:3-oxoacyl-(acyl-carrier-protein) synthase
VAADDVTSEHLLEWFGAGFLSTGAAATDDVIADAALPFDRRRHGMILGMGAAAIVVEHADAARERGLQPICEVVATVTANSAFHGTRLDVEHIGQVMEDVVARTEARTGVSRAAIARRTRPHAEAARPPRCTRSAVCSAPPRSTSWSRTRRASPDTRWVSASKTSSP